MLRHSVDNADRRLQLVTMLSASTSSRGKESTLDYDDQHDSARGLVYAALLGVIVWLILIGAWFLA